MIPVLDKKSFRDAVDAVEKSIDRSLLAFYDHRVKAISKDADCLVAPLDDHMCHRGDGVFETLKFVERRIYQLDEHLARMQRSAAAIKLAPPCPWEQIREICLAVCAAGDEKDGMLRILMGRGPGGFGVNPAESSGPTLYVVAVHYKNPDDAWYARGIKGFHTSVPAKTPGESKIKHVNYLPAVLMTMEGNEKGCDVPFCFDADGYLAESAVANICMVDQNGTLVVPEFTHSMPGTTIRKAMALLEGEVQVEIRKVPEQEIFGMKELLLLGTNHDCAPIVEYEGKVIADGKPGPLSQRLRQLIYKDMLDNGIAF